jgi:hypothetical protein
VDTSESTYQRISPGLRSVPLPILAVLIGMLMTFTAVSRLLYFRGQTVFFWFWTAFYLVVGIGLVKLYQWARVATIVAAIVNICLLAWTLVHGVHFSRPIFLLPVLVRLLLYAFVAFHLLTPKIALAFNAASDGPK